MTPGLRILGSLFAGAVLAIAAPVRPAAALEVELAARTVNRDILALYDAHQEARPSSSRLHRLAEMPLNWLGYKLTYRDVNAPLPDGGELGRYRAIVTWFAEPLANRAQYLAWLDRATASGIKLVTLSEIAPSDRESEKETAQRILERVGLKDADQFVNVTFKSKPLTSDPDMIGFERPLDKVLPPFPVYQPASSATRVYLSLSVPDSEGIPSSSLVVTSPGGGYVADAFTIFYDATSDRARWIVNPFLFFKRALGEERFPVPDVTTLAGRRMYFSHIDGDGWNNISEIEGYKQDQVSAADVIRREVIEPYPDLPVSVGVIAGDVDEDLGGSKSAAESAAKLYALPQVEVASHTYTHPFSWGFFENYDRNAELALIEKASRPAPSVMDRVRGFLYRVAGKSELSEARSKFIAGGADLPRAYLKEPFDVDKEVKGALAVSESLAPAGKKAAIMLWSGDTEVFEAAIRASREAGARNMNGGDTRLDGAYPSVFYVPPISRPVGPERQIYAGDSNENTYTNNWHGPFYGQKLLAETLKNTEAPRRLKPFNLYYHMYSGEKPGALSALKDILALARHGPVIPVKASTYAAIADDFFAAGIAQADAMSWKIANRGALQTFRFDDGADLEVDFERSRGILGLTRANGALYVALDPAVEAAEITLRKAAVAAAETNKDPVYLIESRWQVRDLKRNESCGFAFRAEGYGPGEITWRAEPSRRFEVVVQRAGEVLERHDVAATPSGELALQLATGAIEAVDVGVSCHDS